MSILELFFLAVGLSMDALAVSICKGLAMKKITIGKMALVGLWFGGFQAGMPIIGYFVGTNFAKHFTSVAHWIAFGLLLIIGGNMIREALSKKEDDEVDESLGFKTMLLMAIATSIDALAVGVTFAFMKLAASKLIFAFGFIGITTFLLSAAGVKLGNIFGVKYEKKAELAGGIVLVILGIKILLEGLGVL